MKQRKIPLRTCVVTNEKFEKKDCAQPKHSLKYYYRIIYLSRRSFITSTALSS